MATVSRPNAFRMRRTKLVNPHRKLTMAQKLAGFGGKAKQRAAARVKPGRRPSHRPTGAAYSSRKSRPAGTRRIKSRRNVSAIVTAGLNPYTKKRKGPSKMAKHTQKRRRPNASNKTFKARRHVSASKKRTNPSSHRTRTKYRTRTVVKYRYRSKQNPFARRRRSARRNPSAGGMGTKSLLVNSAVATLNAVGSRFVSQFFLGSANQGITGYGANIGAGLVGAYAAKRFLGRSAGYAALLGLGVSLLLRAAQDFTPWGSALALNGYGDSGMGALVPMDFINPQQYADGNQSVLKPASWQPAPAAAAPVPAARRAGMSGTYRQSTY